MATLRASQPCAYESGVVIEAEYGDNYWINLAWEERGLPEIAGAFPSYEDALAVLREHRDYLEWRGYKIAEIV